MTSDTYYTEQIYEAGTLLTCYVDLDEMADRFPPTEMTFPEALEQSRCGRMIGRSRWGVDPYDTPAEPLTRADINADDWIITG